MANAPTGIMNTGAFANLYDKTFRKITLDEYTRMPPEYSQVAHPFKGEGHYTKEGNMAGIGRMPEKTEGNAVTYDALVQGNSKTVYYTEYAIALAVTQVMQEDDMTGHMKKMFKEIGKSAAYTKELVFWDLFNDSFDGSTYTALDGVALCSNSHVLVNSSTSFDNLGTAAALSKSSLEALYDLHDAFVNETNIPIVSKPKLLVIPPALRWKAKELKLSELDPESGENAINPLKGEFNFLVSHYLTSTTAYWLIDPSEHDLRFITRVPLSLKSDTDFSTDDALFKGRMRIASSFWDYRGIAGNAGA